MFLSSNGKSIAFDRRVNKYGLGEGIVAIILKLCAIQFKPTIRSEQGNELMAFDTLYSDSIKSQRLSLMLFPPLACAPPLSSVYAPLSSSSTGLLAPINRDGVTESEEIFSASHVSAWTLWTRPTLDCACPAFSVISPMAFPTILAGPLR